MCEAEVIVVPVLSKGQKTIRRQKVTSHHIGQKKANLLRTVTSSGKVRARRYKYVRSARVPRKTKLAYPGDRNRMSRPFRAVECAICVQPSHCIDINQNQRRNGAGNEDEPTNELNGLLRITALHNPDGSRLGSRSGCDSIAITASWT